MRDLPVRVLLCVISFALLQPLFGADAKRKFYQESTWQPRAILPTADASRGDFWPASPKAPGVNFDDPGFDSSRLAKAPPPGVYPRVLVTPADVATIRAKVALGDKAPAAFRVMWEREKKRRGPFYALVSEDEALGKSLAARLVEKMKALDPKLDKLDARPDRDNLWAVERSIVASGDPDPPTEIWALLDYDYLHRWMTPEERAMADRLIARITRGRVSNFMVKPDHFLMNNHKGFGMEFLRLLMLIEGTEGFDQAVYDRASQKARVMLDYYLSADGMCYESIKGWLNNSVYVALARRHPELLKHSRLRAKMRFFQNALRWENGRWKIREEMRASAFHVIWMMRYFHPKDPLLDWLSSATFSTHDFLNDAEAKWPDPVGITPELLLLFAEDGMKDKNGEPLDWTDQRLIDAQKLPLTWRDDKSGYVITRNSWDKNDLQLGFTTKQDFYYGGHEGSENNRLVLWADGINWVRDSDMLAVKATFLQNMLTIDGKGLDWPPAPGVWLGVEESPGGVLAAGDGKMGYDFSKVMQVHPLDFPSAQLPYYAPFAEGNFDLTRDHQIAFHPGTVRWNDGYAHTDYGPWSGETRLVESYKTNNPVEQAYRTVYLARGKHPYVLVLDDARKDDKERLYEFNFTVPEGIDLLDAKTAEILFQSVPPGTSRESDLLLGLASTPRDTKTHRAQIQKDDPLLLVRTLWRNTNYGFPVPRFEKLPVEPQAPYDGLAHVTIPAISTSPEFRVLLYPHRQGDPVPETKWNDDRSELTVRIGDDTDRYRFGKTDGGRTVFSVERNGKPVLKSNTPPARPILEVRGTPFDAETLRTTRLEGTIPSYPFDREMEVKLHRPPAPAFITYTLDGSEPTADSQRYDAPLTLDHTARLTARIIDPRWTAGPQESSLLKADFVKTDPARGTTEPPAGSQPGLLARVYEKKTVLWDDKGFFHADRIMLPDLDKETPVTASVVKNFTLPFVNPIRPVNEQAKGFYRFTGWFPAPERGVYEFSVDSCGPVLLEVGGQEAIASVGVFHQHQTVRKGSAVLDTGWHALDLIVTDPLLWNITTAGEMPFSVNVRRDEGDSGPVTADALRCKPGKIPLAEPPAIVWKNAADAPLWLEPGVEVSVFDRDGKLRAPDFLDVNPANALRTERADRIETNIRPTLVRAYEGWFHAPADGIYTFDLPARGPREHLSDLRGAFQNQLRIGDDIVAQHGVAGRRPSGKIGLKTGWHPLSLRLGSSSAAATVTYPDGQSLPLTADLLQRPARVRIGPVGSDSDASLHEIYGPAAITMRLPGTHQGKIRYTLDGTEPTAKSPAFQTGLTVDRDTIITAAAFLPDGRSTARNRVTFQRVATPTFSQIVSAGFDSWDGQTGTTSLDPTASVWIAPGGASVVENGRRLLAVHSQLSDENRPAVDINVARPASGAGLKISGLRMNDNALTVGVWFQSKTANGSIMSKDGLTPFGKRHKAPSLRLNNGQLQAAAAPGLAQTPGGKIAADIWHQVVLTAGTRSLCLYLDGKLVGQGEGSTTLATDSFDFFANHPALVGEIRIYNRVLTPEDIRHWFDATSKNLPQSTAR